MNVSVMRKHTHLYMSNAHESSEDLIKSQILMQEIWSGACEAAFLSNKIPGGFPQGLSSCLLFPVNVWALG